MTAHYHGRIWNHSELARALGASEKTVRRYLEVLEGTFGDTAIRLAVKRVDMEIVILLEESGAKDPLGPPELYSFVEPLK